MSAKTKIIAVCGKGGVGKTSVSAMIATILARDQTKKTLAIDADPAVGLATALGARVERTVDHVRNDLIARIESGEAGDKRDLIRGLDYEIFQALEERQNFAFLAIGRPEKEGCYCQVNTLLKTIIQDLALNFDYVVIDGEAGIEQINRRVMEMVTHLLLITDASAKGRTVVETIAEVAKENVSYDTLGVLLNRIRNPEDVAFVKQATHLPVIGAIADDEMIYSFDREGRSFFELPACPALESVTKLVEEFVFD